MSKIKVLALDLDGTLTNDQKIVTPCTRAALDAAIAQGVTVVLASGRPTAGILPLAKDLGLDKKGGCILSYNGGKIVDCATGETLYEKTLDPAVVPELCAFAAAQDVAVLTYNSEGIVCERDKDEWANKECFTTKLPMIHVDDLASYVDYPICKMLVTLDPARRDAVCAAGQQQFQGRVDLYPSSPLYRSGAAGRGQGRQSGCSAGTHGPDPGQPDGLRRRSERPFHDRLCRYGCGDAERRAAREGCGRLCDRRRQQPRRRGRGRGEVYFEITLSVIAARCRLRSPSGAVAPPPPAGGVCRRARFYASHGNAQKAPPFGGAGTA